MSAKKYYKHPKFGHVYGDTLPTPVGRLCWLSLVTPKEAPEPQPGQQKGPSRYECTLLLDKKAEPTTQFLTALKTMSDEMLVLFNEKRPAKLGELTIVQDGDGYDMEKYPYYKGMWVLAARNAAEPKLYDRDPSKFLPKEFYKGGMKGRMVVTPLITAHGLSYKLTAVQFGGDDGVRFGGGINRDMASMLDLIPEEEIASETVSAVQAANEVLGAPATPQAPATGKTAALEIL